MAAETAESTETPRKEIDTRRPFSRADAIKAGIDARLIRGSRFRRIFRGVYVDASVPVTPKLRAEAALVLFPPKAFASHASAARLCDVPVPTLPDEHVTVFKRGDRRDHAGVRCHVTKSAEVRLEGSVRVSGYRRMFVELASLLPLVELVVVGDNLVRRGLTTPAKLKAYCRLSTLPGASPARAAAAFVRAEVDSPMESRLRMLLVLAGLPEPRINRKIRAVDGEVLRRYDLSYEKSQVIVEYDGRQHIEREEQWESDLERREEIDDDGWRIIVVIAKGVYTHPEKTVRRVHRVLLARREPGVPKVLSDAWRPHFPGRE